MWQIDDITLDWLKVRNASDRVYFVPWKQDPALLSLHVLVVVPADPQESEQLTETISAEEVPGWEGQRVVSPALRCSDLFSVWHDVRRGLEAVGSLPPLPVPVQH